MTETNPITTTADTIREGLTRAGVHYTSDETIRIRIPHDRIVIIKISNRYKIELWWRDAIIADIMGGHILIDAPSTPGDVSAPGTPDNDMMRQILAYISDWHDTR